MDASQAVQQTQMIVDSDVNMYTSPSMPNMIHADRGSPAPNNMSNLQNALNSSPSTTTMSPTPQMKTSANSQNQNEIPTQILTRARLQELVKEIDPTEQLDEDVEEVLLQMADDFVESTVRAACLLAKHRKSNMLEIKDVQLHLERNWNMWIPGFGTDELRPYKRSTVTEAHKQRMALIRKTLKKY